MDTLAADGQVVFYNVLGQQAKALSLKGLQSALSISGLAAGSYHVVIRNGSKSHHKIQVVH